MALLSVKPNACAEIAAENSGFKLPTVFTEVAGKSPLVSDWKVGAALEEVLLPNQVFCPTEPVKVSVVNSPVFGVVLPIGPGELKSGVA